MLKRLSALILVAVALAWPQPASAQLGFMVGLIIGSSINDSSGKAAGDGGSSDVIYRGTFGDRKFEWFKVMSGVTCREPNTSLWDAALRVMKDPNLRDILEIRRVPGLLGMSQCFVFTYYPKGQ